MEEKPNDRIRKETYAFRNDPAAGQVSGDGCPEHDKIDGDQADAHDQSDPLIRHRNSFPAG